VTLLKQPATKKKQKAAIQTKAKRRSKKKSCGTNKLFNKKRKKW
jgi:hypothetical protein